MRFKRGGYLLSGFGLSVALFLLWPAEVHRDPRLIGEWVTHPDSYDGFPFKLSADGTAQFIDIYCGISLPAYRWSTAGNELRLERPLPSQLPDSLFVLELTLRRLQNWISGREAPDRFRILELPGGSLSLQKLGAASFPIGDFKAYRRPGNGDAWMFKPRRN